MERNSLEKRNFISIAIVMPDMELGGAEKSFLTFIEMFKGKSVSVSLLLFHRTGALLSHVPDWVKVIELPGAGRLDRLRKKGSNFLARCGLTRFYDIFKHFYHLFGSGANFGKKYKNIDYDVVIAYKDGTATWFARNIIARVKIAFFHTDFVRAGYNPIKEKKVYDSFDQIYCVSSAAKKSFVQALPALAEKTSVFYTIIDQKKLHSSVKFGPSFLDDFNGIRILTVGRLSHEKGLDKAIKALSLLKVNGYYVRWYIVGEGCEKSNLSKLIAANHLQDDFIFLGEVENPYRLMADCDIYVQPSNYEGYCLAIAEARALYCPIVACDFSGAKEQIVNRETGIITGMSAENLYEGISQLIRDNDLREKIKNNLKKPISQDAKQFDELYDFITRKLGL
ncbi:glycosyltransferase [Desulfitobacterium dehalogenans ATCC 51507]|uniref:Glycosyltransferase n=2 Tax=Desulfitobacterium dehalogenans TaxID=36854 RepID=I4ADR4_DESDJ|nr:glycosyltransferase [Desulfitobacterium dehalogenans ATCC 51507]